MKNIAERKKSELNDKNNSIAVIGIGCRLPGGANSPKALWKMLVNKTDAVTEIPSNRWNADAMYHPDYTTVGKISVRKGGFIDEIDKWDASFFNVSPLEALRIDPQHRLLLEVAYNAIEDSGLRLEDINGTKTGVFVGISSHDYGDIQNSYSERALIGSHTNSGGAQSIAANRVSYTFNLRGPSFSVDTACSSSLTAIHLACRSIREGESDMALAGGVNVILKPETEIGFNKGGFLAPDGLCKAFDAEANGYIRSEGAGMVILKPLSKAVADGDLIYAVVRGSAINQDGRTGGITVPNPAAQREVILSALKNAVVDPVDVQYIEAHGTGTAVGDPIEGNVIGEMFGSVKPDRKSCFMGSIKSNIGHLEPASGIAGFIKLALSIYNGYILPNIHFNTPNPAIAFDKYKIRVPVEITPWKKKKYERFGGVNSFGFGGANAHVVMQGYEANGREVTPSKGQKTRRNHSLFFLSARSENAMKELVKRYIEYIDGDGREVDFEDMCYSAALRRSHHSMRMSIVASDKKDLKEKLNGYLKGLTQPGMLQGRKIHKSDVKKAFVFSGQGPQWWAMGRQLFEKEPLFRSSIIEIDGLFKTNSGWSLINELTKDEEKSRIYETRITQPAIFAVQVSLARMWKSMGIVPDGIVGHSIGEVAAAYISGVLTLPDAVKLIYHRSRVQAKAEGKGKMVAVGMGVNDAEKLIVPYKNDVSVAAINSPAMVTLSGNTDVLEKITQLLEKRDVFFKYLKVAVPFHSHYMEPLENELIKSLESLEPRAASTPLYSTVTGDRVRGDEYTADYWFRNVREPVYFTTAIDAMIKDGYELFIEISPHPVLSSGITEILSRKKWAGTVVPSIRRKEDEWFVLLNSMGMIYITGASWDMDKLYGADRKYVKLPAYPYQKDRYWLESDESLAARIGNKLHPHLEREIITAREKNSRIWEIVLDHRTDPYIRDHRVQGPIVFPGAGHVELGISAALNSFGSSFCFLENINFKRALFLPDDGEPPMIHLEILNDGGNYYLYTKDRKADSQWEMCSEGMINHIEGTFETKPVDISAMRAKITDPIDVAVLHKDLDQSGLSLGPAFRAISELYCGKRESVAVIDVPEQIKHDFHRYNLHPSVLDSCFQTLFGAFFSSDEHVEKMGVYIPIHIDRVKFHKKPESFRLYTYAKLLQHDDQNAMGDLWIFDENGEIVAEFQGFLTQYLKGSRGEIAGESSRWFYEYVWEIKYRKDQEKKRSPCKYFPAPDVIKESVDKAIDEIHLWPNQKKYYEFFEPEFDVLTVSYIVEALLQLGISLNIGDVVNVRSLLKDKMINKRHSRLFKNLFLILERNGFLEAVNDSWRVVKKPLFKKCTEQLKDINRNFTDFKQEIELLGRCGPELCNVLLGKVNPVELIFPENKWNTIVDYYVNGFSFKKYNHIVSSVMSAVLKKVPDGKPLRILEIGAGTGGVTQAILPHLPHERTEYFYTDLSHMFMMKARNQFQEYPFVKYRLLNIEKDPFAQGFEKNSFDLIIASDVVHATKRVKETLERVRGLLASEGQFLMVEVTRAPIYLDLIFGMTEGWWLYEDTDLRKNHATMPSEKWVSVLEETGFQETAVFSDISDNCTSSQCVIISRGPKLKISDNNLTIENFNGEKWVVFTGKHKCGQNIVDKMTEKNADVIVVQSGDSFKSEEKAISLYPGDETQIDKTINAITRDGHLAGIVYLWPLDSVRNEMVSEETIVENENSILMPLLHLITKLNENAPGIKLKVYMVTHGAQIVRKEDPPVRISDSGFRGVGRTVINEFPVFKSCLVDLSKIITDVEIDVFIDEIIAGEREDEIAFRGDIRYVNRLVRVTEEAARQAARKMVEADGYAFSANVADYGVLDSIYLHEIDRAEIKPDQIEVQVKAAALNFRDIMVAMGLINGEAIEGGMYGKKLGLEVCGIVSRVGKNVTKFSAGDEVAGFAINSLGGFVVGSQKHFVKKINGLSVEQMAALPLVYLTAYYSLTRLANVAKGEKVLIHAAAGGVGIAAIQIAFKMGADVYATAGSNEKREYLRSIGVKHIYDSRTLTFADEIMRDTCGAGVDVVLNALSGPAIYKSLKCLAPFGRFIEMGKTDIYRNSQIGLKNFGNNISYHVVDVDRMLKHKPELAGKILSDVMMFFADNSLNPHPVKEFNIREIQKAFMYMAAARHIGKVVITMKGRIKVDMPTQISFKRNETFLITGGCSGFGLRVAQWIAEKGAGTLVLINRNGPKTDKEKSTIIGMKDNGINVIVEKADVTKKEDMLRVFKYVEMKCPPLKGIFHCAMVLDDASIPEMTSEKFARAYRPKALGCWNIHEVSKKNELDFFVMFSSISSIYGNPGQVNYAAGNSFLDEMTRYRRSQGLPATTINWGVIGEAGFVARTSHVRKLLAKQGWYTFSMREALGILEKMLLEKPVQRVAINNDWEKIGEMYPNSKETNRFFHLISESENVSDASGGKEDTAIKTELLSAPEEERIGLLKMQLKDVVSRVLGTSSDKLDENESITALGLDSLMANQIRAWINNNLCIEYSMMRIMKGPTLLELCDHLMGELNEGDNDVIEYQNDKSTKLPEMDRWIIRTHKIKKPEMRLFCFPYFAGGASVFSTWYKLLPEKIEVCSMQFPGREERVNETAYDDVNKLVKKIAEIIEPLLDVPFAFYAHSLGALVAFELARHLEQKKGLRLEQFIVGGWPSPDKKNSFKILENVSEEEVYDIKNTSLIIDHLRSIGVPEEVVVNDKLMDEMLPSLRADIVMGKKYHFVNNSRLECPIVAIAATRDPLFRSNQLESWKKLTNKAFTLNMIKGGHLFARDNKDDLLDLIAEQLEQTIVNGISTNPV